MYTYLNIYLRAKRDWERGKTARTSSHAMANACLELEAGELAWPYKLARVSSGILLAVHRAPLAANRCQKLKYRLKQRLSDMGHEWLNQYVKCLLSPNYIPYIDNEKSFNFKVYASFLI